MTSNPNETIGADLRALQKFVCGRAIGDEAAEVKAVQAIEAMGCLASVEAYDGLALQALAEVVEFLATNPRYSSPVLEDAVERVTKQAIQGVQGHKMLTVHTPNYWDAWGSLNEAFITAAYTRFISGSEKLKQAANNLTLAVNQLKPAHPPHQPSRELIVGGG